MENEFLIGDVWECRIEFTYTPLQVYKLAVDFKVGDLVTITDVHPLSGKVSLFLKDFVEIRLPFYEFRTFFKPTETKELPDIGNYDVAMHVIAEAMNKRMEEEIIRNSNDIEHPPHYTRGNKEVIVVLQDALTPDEYKGFLKGNIIKYTLRAGFKDDKEMDLAKAKWYIDKLKEVD